MPCPEKLILLKDLQAELTAEGKVCLTGTDLDNLFNNVNSLIYSTTFTEGGSFPACTPVYMSTVDGSLSTTATETSFYLGVGNSSGINIHENAFCVTLPVPSAKGTFLNSVLQPVDCISEANWVVLSETSPCGALIIPYNYNLPDIKESSVKLPAATLAPSQTQLVTIVNLPPYPVSGLYQIIWGFFVIEGSGEAKYTHNTTVTGQTTGACQCDTSSDKLRQIGSSTQCAIKGDQPRLTMINSSNNDFSFDGVSFRYILLSECCNTDIVDLTGY